MKKIIKKLFTLIITVSFIGIIIEGAIVSSKFTMVKCENRKDRLQTIKEKSILIVGTANEPPFLYIDSKTKNLVGIDADIIKEITKRLEVNKIEIKEAPFSNLLNTLNADDNIDIAANGIYITPEREEIVSFTQPLYKQTESVIVPIASKINFMDDLKDAVVGSEKGTAFSKLAQEWKEKGLVKDAIIFENIPELLNSINNGKIDAAIIDSVVINYFLANNKNLYLRTLKSYNPQLAGIAGIAVKKSDTDLLNALNEKISEMKADGTLYSILVKNGLDKSNVV